MSDPAGYHYTNDRMRPRLDYLARFLEAGCGMRHVGTLPCGTIIVADASYPSGGDWWTICDNGGELNVEKINHPETMRSVPYVQWTMPSPIGRLYHFVVSVMQGDEIETWASSPTDDVTLEMLTAREAAGS